MHQFLKFIFGKKLYMFRTVPLSFIRSFSLYTQQWYMSQRFADVLRAICQQVSFTRLYRDALPTEQKKNRQFLQWMTVDTGRLFLHSCNPTLLHYILYNCTNYTIQLQRNFEYNGLRKKKYKFFFVSNTFTVQDNVHHSPLYILMGRTDVFYNQIFVVTDIKFD